MSQLDQPLSDAQAADFSRLALRCIATEYPNAPMQVLAGPDDARSPRALHPVFYGCFDWHSAVHSHWLLVRLLKCNPGHPAAAEARAALAERFTADALRAEAEYFDAPNNRGFERMYGWAWVLRLALELRTWVDPDARSWAANLAPLEQRLAELMLEYLPRLEYPLRTGVHPNTAFALGQGLDYAAGVGAAELDALLRDKAVEFFGSDQRYPVNYEPSGEDFFSPALAEADLMRRVLPRREFSQWLDRFLPDLRSGRLGPLLVPVEVRDMRDGRIGHLAGLNLHRAWTMQAVARALQPGDVRIGTLEASAKEHLDAGLGHVFSGCYEGEHWMGTFAVYALTGVDGG